MRERYKLPVTTREQVDGAREHIPVLGSLLSIFAKPIKARSREPVTDSISGCSGIHADRPRPRLSGIWNKLTRRSVATPDLRLEVLNLTRHTVLASCVEVAGNTANRRKGLLGRDGLGSGEGLLIRPCEAVHTFGMRFPIDLVYMDRLHQIKKIRSNVRPWRLSACLSAHSVLELAAGTIRESQSRPGDKLKFSPVLK